MLKDKIILITGGTGSFGKAFINECLSNHDPAKLIIYSRDENKQFHLAKELSNSFPEMQHKVQIFHWRCPRCCLHKRWRLGKSIT